jgi:hypothetical protein
MIQTIGLLAKWCPDPTHLMVISIAGVSMIRYFNTQTPVFSACALACSHSSSVW